MSANQKSKRKPLSAERIAAAALELIDREGLDGFSFRHLARNLGCEAMSIYHYFPSKAHLFDELVAACIREVRWPPADLPWHEQLRLWAREFRKVALRHPGFFLYFAIYRMNSRAGMGFLDAIISTVAKSGLPPERQAAHFRTFGYYVMGAGLDESMGYVKGPSSSEPVSDAEAARDFPAIVAVSRYFGKTRHEEIFEGGLDALIRRMQEDAVVP